MKKVRWVYTRNTHRRVIRQSDFKNLGVKVDADVTFSSENNFTVLMEDEACDALVSKLPTEFVVVNELPAEKAGVGVGPLTLDFADQSADSKPEGSSSESEDAATGDGAQSSPARRRNR